MRRFGKYVLVGRISSGGMADVYRARVVGIRGFSKTVAIKRIFPHLLERQRFLRMFTDEAKISSRLLHPNIVQIHELGEDRGVPYIAMEYVAGRDLFLVVQRLARAREAFPVGLARRVVAEVCSGLEYAHRFGIAEGSPQEIVHRDVSPRNVLIGWTGEVKLTDFGVARARDREEHTEHGLIKGKIRYLSPEAAAGRELDGRSDLFSLGVVLAEMVLMAPLHAEPNDLAVLMAIRDGKLDLDRLKAFPGGLRPVLDHALATDPGRRFPSAAAFRDAILDPHLDCEPPFTAEQTERFMRERFAEEIERELARDREVDAILASESAQAELSGTAQTAAAADPAPAAAAPPVVRTLPPPRFSFPATPKEEVRPAFEGSLAVDSLAGVLHRLAVEHATGRLDLVREPLVKSVFLELGDPVFIVSNSSAELFGEHLVARGLLSTKEHSSAMDYAASKGVRFSEALLSLHILAPHQLYRFLGEQVRDRILELFTWTAGRYLFFSGLEPPELGIPLDLKAYELIHEGVGERLPLATIRRALDGHLRQTFTVSVNGRPESLRLSGREQRLLRVIESEAGSIGDVIRRERDEEQVLRLAYLLRETGCLSFREAEDMA